MKLNFLNTIICQDRLGTNKWETNPNRTRHTLFDAKKGVDYATWGQYVEWSVMEKFNKANKGGGKRTMMLGCQVRSPPR